MKQEKLLEKNLENPFNGGFYIAEFQTSENGGEWIGSTREFDETASVWHFNQQNSSRLSSGDIVYGGYFLIPRNHCLTPPSIYLYNTAERTLCVYHYDKIIDLHLVERVSETEFWLTEIENKSGWRSRIRLKKL